MDDDESWSSWSRRMLSAYIVEALLVVLIGFSIVLMILGDLSVTRGRGEGHDLMARGWLRGQTVALIGVLLGRLSKGKNGRNGNGSH